MCRIFHFAFFKFEKLKKWGGTLFLRAFFFCPFSPFLIFSLYIWLIFLLVSQIYLRPHFFFFLYLCYSGCIISIVLLFSLITLPFVSSYLLLICSNEFFILSKFLTPEFSFDLFYNFYCVFFFLYLVRHCYHSFNSLGVVSFNFEDNYDDCFEVICLSSAESTTWASSRQFLLPAFIPVYVSQFPVSFHVL